LDVAESLLNKARNLLRTSPAEPAAAAPAAKKISTAHHAVSIAPGPRCCAQAREQQGQRFLSREAPPLPLQGCSQPNCSCRYIHHEDRRAKPRRARDMGVTVDGWLEDERRGDTKRGRRKADRSDR
jgi:hypothetical protein